MTLITNKEAEALIWDITYNVLTSKGFTKDSIRPHLRCQAIITEDKLICSQKDHRRFNYKDYLWILMEIQSCNVNDHLSDFRRNRNVLNDQYYRCQYMTMVPKRKPSKSESHKQSYSEKSKISTRKCLIDKYNKARQCLPDVEVLKQ